MTRIKLLSAVIALILIGGCSGKVIDYKKIFSNLQWISGKWVATDVTNYTEIWKRANDTCYQGLSVSPADGDSLVEEQLQIVLRKNGIHFINSVEEQTDEEMTQDFELISSSSDSLVFANKGTFYPNQITYKRLNDTLMKVKVERKDSLNEVKFEYTLKRVKK